MRFRLSRGLGWIKRWIENLAKHKLSAVKVKNAPPGKYSDGDGLWLHVRADGGGQWVLRVTVNGRRREMGLGSASNVSLKAAREKAQHWRGVAAGGEDPIRVREAEKRLASRSDASLRKMAEEAFEARKAELKDGGKAGRWFSPLEKHILPKLGKRSVEDIDARDIRDTLKPIWHTKADPARKALNRTGIVLKYAAALGLDVDLQATQKAKALLGKTTHVPKNIPALHWKEVPDFYASLNDPTITQLALRFLILTAARSSEVRFMCEAEVQGNIWTIPAERMKNGIEHRIPLSKEALKVLEEAAPFTRGNFYFPSVRKGVISDATMGRFMERRGMTARPHGFRSSFRTWCAEATDTSRDVAETALSHVTGGAVERAYRRTDFLEQREILMERWADHVTGGSGKILKMVANDE